MFRASYKKRYIKYEIIIIISYCISAWFECLCKTDCSRTKRLQ